MGRGSILRRLARKASSSARSSQRCCTTSALQSDAFDELYKAGLEVKNSYIEKLRQEVNFIQSRNAALEEENQRLRSALQDFSVDSADGCSVNSQAGHLPVETMEREMSRNAQSSTESPAGCRRKRGHIRATSMPVLPSAGSAHFLDGCAQKNSLDLVRDFEMLVFSPDTVSCVSVPSSCEKHGSGTSSDRSRDVEEPYLRSGISENESDYTEASSAVADEALNTRGADFFGAPLQTPPSGDEWDMIETAAS